MVCDSDGPQSDAQGENIVKLQHLVISRESSILSQCNHAWRRTDHMKGVCNEGQ